MKICNYQNCGNKILAKGLCGTHYARVWRNGTVETVRPKKNSQGYVNLQIDGYSINEHVYLAEKALGKRLPHGAIVHHMNEKRDDNYTYFNLVVCPDHRYHMLLHKRMRLQKEGRLK